MELFIKEQKLKLNLKTWVKLLYIVIYFIEGLPSNKYSILGMENAAVNLKGKKLCFHAAYNSSGDDGQ